MIKEYPSEFGNKGEKSAVRNMNSVCSYRVGIAFGGSLLCTAPSAPTADGSPRRHNKLDDSGFLYNGRSYGVGSSVGLTYNGVKNDALQSAVLIRRRAITSTLIVSTTPTVYFCYSLTMIQHGEEP